MNLEPAAPVIVARAMETVLLGPPSHWPPRLTRMALSVRLGITRLLLERRA